MVKLAEGHDILSTLILQWQHSGRVCVSTTRRSPDHLTNFSQIVIVSMGLVRNFTLSLRSCEKLFILQGLGSRVSWYGRVEIFAEKERRGRLRGLGLADHRELIQCLCSRVWSIRQSTLSLTSELVMRGCCIGRYDTVERRRMYNYICAKLWCAQEFISVKDHYIRRRLPAKIFATMREEPTAAEPKKGGKWAARARASYVRLRLGLLFSPALAAPSIV